MHQAWQSWQRGRGLWIAAGVFASSIMIFVIARLLMPASSSQIIDSTMENQTSGTEFFNVVIFGVNDLQEESPKLAAVWVGTFEIIGKEGVLLGLPRTFQLADSQSLEHAFAWTSGAGLSPDFLSGVETTLGLHFNAAVVMDEICFQSSVDFIGGIPLADGGNLDGLSALALHKLSAADPWMALDLQARLLTSASQSLADLSETTDLSPLLEPSPDHCWLTMSDETAVDLFLRLLPIDQDAIRVDTLAAFD